MHVVAEAPMAPGSCYLTDTSAGPFIDTLIDVDERAPYGRVYLAVSTVENLGQMLGMLSAEYGKRLKAENRRLRDELSAKDDALDAERAANTALQAAGFRHKKERARAAS